MKSISILMAIFVLLSISSCTTQNQERTDSKQLRNSIEAVSGHYFTLKDALVASDAASASSHAEALVQAINAVKMDELSAETHTVWMQVMNDLKSDAEYIKETKELVPQRDRFDTLSDKMYQLLKVSKQETPIYYQHCPMANDGKGANWLSKENVVKNPYYGSEMLSCGKTVEMIE